MGWIAQMMGRGKRDAVPASHENPVIIANLAKMVGAIVFDVRDAQMYTGMMRTHLRVAADGPHDTRKCDVCASHLALLTMKQATILERLTGERE